MRVDKYHTLISEEHNEDTEKGFHGNRGESQAVTSRVVDLALILGESTILDLNQFVTPTGTCRHPRSQWQEAHESTDQAISFYMGASKQIPPLAIQMKERIIANGYRTGNKNLISPSFYALMMNKQRLLDLTIVGQRLIFVWPWRWNEEKKEIESSNNSSCDWINFIHLLYYASPWVRKLVSKEKLKERVRHYFSREPNSLWLLDLYVRAIDRIMA